MKTFNHKGLMAFLSVALLFGFAFGIAGLFVMRFEAGDVYPAYSSLRADPLGAKVFYDSLDGLHDLRVDRNYGPESRLKGNQGLTVFDFGTRADDLGRANAEDVKALESLMIEGANIVILLYPENAKAEGYLKEKKQQIEKDKASEKERSSKPNEDCRKSRRWLASLPGRWGFSLAYFESSGGSFFRGDAVSVYYDRALPASVSWHSALHFEKLDDRWEKVYAVNDFPVVIKRNFGKGGLVLATDSYFVSNEALLRERHADLLTWLVGNGRRVVFDETHLGVRENPGIAALARKYRLHGLFAGVILVGLLFVWKSSFSLIPPRTEDASSREAYAHTGKDSFSGFVSLLRKNIARRDILAACLEQWRKTFPRRLGEQSPEFKQARSIVEAQRRGSQKEQDLVRTYRQIAGIIRERKSNE